MRLYKKINKSLRAYGIVLLLFTLLSLGVTYDLKSGHDRILGQRAEAALQKSQLIAESFNVLATSSRYLLGDILDRLKATDLGNLPVNAEYTQTLNTLLKSKRQTLPSLLGIALYDKDCIFVADSSPEHIGYKTDERLCEIRQQLKNNDRMYVHYLPTDHSASKSAVIALSRNFYDENDRFVGGVVAAIDLKFAAAWISEFSVARGDSLVLTDAVGTLLARNPNLPGAMGTIATQPEFLSVFASGIKGTTFIAESPFDHTRRIYGMSHVKDFPFYIVVGVNESDALTEWFRRSWQITIALVLLLTVAMLFAKTYLQLLGQREELKSLAMSDSLTGVTNHRYFFEILREHIQSFQKNKNPLSVLMLDIDHFKSINDTWEHAMGDQVLRSFTQIIATTLREPHVLSRIGGEEFAIILPDTDAHRADIIATRIKESIEHSDTLSAEGDLVRVTTSIGVTSLLDTDNGPKEVIARADRALYMAKHAGRNRICVQ